MDRETVRRQLESHLQSLRTAGVEWLPRGEPLRLTAAAASAFVRGASSGNAVTTPAADAAPVVAPPGSAGSGVDDRRQALTVLAEQVKSCVRCPELASTRTQIVFGDGRPGVELCFIGEAPGADEDAQGVPFVGAAGQLLNKIIAACGFRREDVYICNILKCRPPGNRTPLPNEAANCRGFLDQQLETVQPKFICTLGGCAANNLLQLNVPLGKLRGRFHDYRGIPVICTYHPAYLLPHRAPEKKREVWEDMKMLLKKMGREVPQSS